MANEKYYQLVERLTRKTENRELEWKEGVYPNSFQVSFSNYSLTLEQQPGPDGSTDYVIQIIDAAGNAIDRFSDVDLGGEYYQQLYELYQNARRQALGVDKALDEILSDLDNPF